MFTLIFKFNTISDIRIKNLWKFWGGDAYQWGKCGCGGFGDDRGDADDRLPTFPYRAAAPAHPHGRRWPERSRTFPPGFPHRPWRRNDESASSSSVWADGGRRSCFWRPPRLRRGWRCRWLRGCCCRSGPRRRVLRRRRIPGKKVVVLFSSYNC